MKTRWPVLAVTGLTMLAACGGAEEHAGLVARVGDQTFTVDQAVKLLEDQENLPNQDNVVRAVAELWVDYTLLANEVARDSTLKNIDLEPLIRQQLEQQMVFELRDSVIQVDTAISDADLETLYEKEAPGARVKASHILFSYPDQATQAQKDSVRREAEAVRRRALAGESFSALAREYSQDPGSARQGGELGTFGRGEMVRPVEDAAFSMEPGQISDLVESPYGLHIIRLEEKEVPGFDQMRDSFRVRVQNQRYAVAESTYVANLQDKVHPQVTDDAVSVVKAIAKDPSVRLSSRAADRPLVAYDGGAVTVGEYQMVVQSRPDDFRQSVQQATDEQIDTFLKSLAQRDLLVEEAKKAGLEPPQARVDSLVTQARQQLLAVAGEIGLRRLDRAPGEALAPAVARAVQQALLDILTGAKDVVPLGQISYQLREDEPSAIFDDGVGQVLLKVGQIRAARSPAAADTSGQGTADTTSTGPNGG
jgi:parvulin-like peptidyl-prolyl isomerase